MVLQSSHKSFRGDTLVLYTCLTKENYITNQRFLISDREFQSGYFIDCEFQTLFLMLLSIKQARHFFMIINPDYQYRYASLGNMKQRD